MDYQDELRAKLDATYVANTLETTNPTDVSRQEQQILQELSQEFEFSQYDLQESDLLRVLKIESILSNYPKVFEHKSALQLFYTLCRVDIITAKNLLLFSKLSTQEFKTIINTMAKAGLVFKNETAELELTLEGKSLASRIGVDIFI